MGSSKKHKEKDRESKKKRKHRSRSRSKSRERKKRHRDRSPEREEDTAYYQRRDNGSYAHDYDDSGKPKDYHRSGKTDFSANVEEKHPDSAAQQSGDGSSLSIGETNRLRAKLGLKPLDIGDAKGENTATKSSEVHAPPINLGDKKKTDRLREKVAARKAQRQIESKLTKVKGLGDSDSDEDARAWVRKSRKQEHDKVLAEKRAKMLEEMDQDFGIGNIVEQEFKKSKAASYSSHDLSGLRVEHTLDKFSEGRKVILTLKDKGVLDEDDEGDVLVNVNIEDDERAEKNVETKKTRPDYKPYDEPEYDEYGMMKPVNMLSKYDEEIEGIKKESFTLGSGGNYNATHEKRMSDIRQQLRAQGQSLEMAAPKLTTEYMTKEEVEAKQEAAKFKKVRKKVRKIRKKSVLKADDLLPLEEEDTTQNYGSRSRGRGKVEPVEEEMEEGEVKQDDVKHDLGDTAFHTGIIAESSVPVKPEPIKLELEDADIMGPDEDLSGVNIEEDEAHNELQGVLARARKLNLKKEKKNAIQMIQDIPQGTEEEDQEAVITLNSTSEFCRNLGEIPTYGLSGNREEDRDELMDLELELMEQRRQQAEQEDQTGGWNEVDIDENPVDIVGEDAAVLEEEPIASDGIGAALQLAMKKGYIENEAPKRLPGMSKDYEELQAQNYTIQDKRYDDLDEKNRKRERYAGGMISEFKEKASYKPEVKLDYVDEMGRCLSQKEAFRQLSHRFHGKGSGKKKTEKRGKKVEEELLMKQMSSTDTPLNTLSLLKDKQKSEKSPYIMLSGNKGFSANSIVKPS